MNFDDIKDVSPAPAAPESGAPPRFDDIQDSSQSQAPQQTSQDSAQPVQHSHGILGWVIDKLLGNGQAENLAKLKDVVSNLPGQGALQKAESFNKMLNQTNDLGAPDERVGNIYAQDKHVSNDFLNTTINNLEAVKPAFSDYMGESHGVLGQVGNVLTQPEQLLTREAVAVAQQVGSMPPEDAKKILSQNALYPSDLVNYYWKDPSNIGSRVARFAIGMGANILFDPLYPVAGLGKYLGNTNKVELLGQTQNLEKMAASERAVIKTASSVENIITADHEFIDAPKAFDADHALANNLNQVHDFSAGKINALDLQKGLNVSDTVKGAVSGAVEALGQPKGYFEEMAQGERGLRLALHIPFTGIYQEFDAPFIGPIQRAFGKGAVALMGGLSKIDDGLGNYPSKIINMASKVATKTGIPVWDQAINEFHGDTSDINNSANKLFQSGGMLLKGSTVNDAKNIIDILENETPNIAKVLEAHAPSVNVKTEADVFNYRLKEDKLIEGNKFAAQIAQGLSQPQLEFKDLFRKTMDDIYDSQSKIGLLQKPMDPFRGEGSVNNYVPHVVSSDYLQKNKDLTDSIRVGQEILRERLGSNVDRSALGRDYTGSINKANEITQKVLEVPKYVNDPLELMVHRYVNGRTAIRNYKLMDDALNTAKVVPSHVFGEFAEAQKLAETGDEEAASKLLDLSRSMQKPKGYVEFNPDHFKELYVQTTSEGSIAKDADGKIITGFRSQGFLPQEYSGNNKIYLPEDVYSRMRQLINPYREQSTAQLLLNQVANATKYLKTAYLTSKGFVGLTAVGRTTDFFVNGPFTPFTSLYNAIKMYALPGEQTFQFKFGDTVRELSKDEMWANLAKYNVRGSSMMDKVQWNDVTDKVASLRDMNKEMGTIPKTALEFATFYRTARSIVQHTDDFFKTAYYMDRLNAGFSFEGAAEATEKVFFNFNNQSQAAKNMSTAWIFSSHPMKAIESAVSKVAEGPLAQLSIPEKVTHVLEGAYIQDPQVRQAITQQLPMYDQIKDLILGPLLPGQRQVSLDIPWSNGTMSFFLDPQKNLNPFVSLIATALSSHSNTRFDGDVQGNKYLTDISHQADQLMPWLPRMALSIAEVNGFLGDTTKISPQGIFGNIEKSPITDGGVPHFRNSVEFGKYMEDQMGSNWLYRLFFKPLNGELMGEQEQLAARGNFIGKQFRDMSAGLGLLTRADQDMHRTDKAFDKNIKELEYQKKRAFKDLGTSEEMMIKDRWDNLMSGKEQLSPMDRNFLVNMGAMNRQYEQLSEQMKSDIAAKGLLPNPKALENWEDLKIAAKVNPIASKMVALRHEKMALHNFYSWWIHANQDAQEKTGVPGYNPFKLLFGLDQVKFDEDSMKDRQDLNEMSPMLNPGRTQFNDLQDRNNNQ